MTAALPTYRPAPPRGYRVPLFDGPGDVRAALGRCVVTIGVFDGLHRGHRRLVDRAVAAGRDLALPVVLVTFDPHPARVLGLDRDTAALSTVGHRAELAADAGADAVCVLHFTPALAAASPAEFARDVLARDLGAAAVVVGANFTFGARGAGTAGTLARLGDRLGFRTHAVPLVQDAGTPCSSTYTRRCLREGRLAAAHRAQGRPHRVDGHRHGTVVELASGTALPPPGRYRALVDGVPGRVAVRADDRIELLGDGPGPPGPIAGSRPTSVAFLDHDPAR